MVNSSAGQLLPFITDPSERAEALLQSELRRVIQSLYGPPIRHLPGLDVGRSYWGTTEDFRYGGDLVDVFQYGNGTTSLAVVDIAGHGIRAARHAGLAKYALRAYASLGFTARASILALNRLFMENIEFESEYEFFATAFFAIIDERRHAFEYVSAGHEAACLLTSTGAHMLGATAPIVGVVDDDAAFASRMIELRHGDVIAAVTDGFTEARNEAHAFLGADALADVIGRNRTRAAEVQAESVTRHAYEYAGARLTDDVASLVVKVDLG